MAEQLGQAVLEITVDDKKLRDGLNRARNTIERAGGEFKINLGGSEQQLQRLAATAKTLETQLKKLQSTPLNLGTRDLAKLGGDFSKAGTEVSAFTRSVINGDTALANSTAGLRQQALAFRTLAANVKFTSTEFKNFTQAAAKAGQKELFAGFEQIKAQESLFKLGGFGGNDTFKGTEQLLEFSKRVGNTPAAINLYINALEQALSVTSTTDANFAKLTAEIQRQGNALNAAAEAAERYIGSLRSQRAALPPAQGPAPFTPGPLSPEEAAAEERRKRREQKLADRLDYISTGGRDQSFVPPNFAARPNPENIRAEERLQQARRRTRQETIKAAEAEDRARAARRKRFKEAAGNALIGGAFPALFGQGIGASIGGAVGGGLGGFLGGNFGFGLSLVGTAVGQRFDDISKALENPIENFEQLKTAGALSSKSLETLAGALIETGRSAEANLLIQKDLRDTYGIDGLAGFQEVRGATDELNRAFGQLSAQLGSFIAGPLATFLRELAKATENQATGVRFQNVIDQLDPQQYERVRRITDQATRDAQRARGGNTFLPPSEGDVAKGREAGIRAAEEILGLRKSEEQVERELAALRARNAAQLQNSYRLIAAQVQGNKEKELDYLEEEIKLRRESELAELRARGVKDPNDPRIQEVKNRAKLDLFRVEEQRKLLPEDGSIGKATNEVKKLEERLTRIKVGTEAFRQLTAEIIYVTDEARKLESQVAQIRFDELYTQLAFGDIALSFANVEDAIKQAEIVVRNADFTVDPETGQVSEQVQQAITQLVYAKQALDTLNNTKAIIEVEVLTKGFANGDFSNAIAQTVALREATAQLNDTKARIELDIIATGLEDGQLAKNASNVKRQLELAKQVFDQLDFSDIGADALGLPPAPEMTVQDFMGAPGDALKKLESLYGEIREPVKFDIDASPIASALRDVIELEQEVTRLDGKKAQFTVEVIQQGLADFSLDSTVANLKQLQDAAKQVFDSSELGSDVQIRAAAAYSQAGERLSKAAEALNQTPEKLRQAAEALRGTLQSGFKFLPRDQRKSLLESARADIERGRQSGILRPNFGAAGRRRTFEAADFVRNVERQRQDATPQAELVAALRENTNAERNIRINVTMNADGSASVTQTEQQAALL